MPFIKERGIRPDLLSPVEVIKTGVGVVISLGQVVVESLRNKSEEIYPAYLSNEEVDDGTAES